MDGTQYEIGTSSEANKGITQSQYHHLISLVEKMQSNDSKQINHDAPHAMLVGKFCFLSSINGRWFIDSGATDHWFVI